MQYTGSSFADPLTGGFASWWVRPAKSRQGPLGLFPPAGSFASQTVDRVLESVYRPGFEAAGHLLATLRVFQRGQVQTYLLYLLGTLIVLLLWQLEH
jgi:hypothetical protein